MAGIALIAQLGGSPVSRSAIERFLAPMAHRGPDGCKVDLQGAVALGHWNFRTTPQEAGEEQPLEDASGCLHLAFDGRLDNRQELLAALGDRGQECPSDAALVLAAYGRWGRRCLERFLGPFAFVLYDGPRRSILCGRDALGDRSLYYFSSPTHFLAASEEGALLAHPAVPGDVDETSLARFFAMSAPAAGRTFFRAIHELPAGHGLWIEAGRLELWRHWHPPWDRELSYRREAEYMEHFRSLLDDSVRCRLRALAEPAILMSGGLDSTSIAALAAPAVSSGSGSRLLALSWIFPDLPACDERSFFRPVVRRCGLDSLELPADHLWPLGGDEAWPTTANAPTSNPYRRLLDRAYAATRQAGKRVLLNGWFGDHLWIGGRPGPVDLLRGGRLLAAARGALTALRRPQPVSAAQRWPWLTPFALERLNTEDEADADPRRRVFEGLHVWNAAVERSHAHRCGIETRQPYRDRRLVEFMLALPARQASRRGPSKPLLRRAMANDLPAAVFQPSGRRGLLDDLFVRGLFHRERHEVSRLLGGRQPLWRDYVRPSWLSPMTDQEETKSWVMRAVLPWQCASAELWSRRLAKSPRRAATQHSEISR